ncbi:hypothetical protein [Paracoccus marcusii]|uniref:hypothetical protein n=1 Tax=Paracoccus marcusii TaxID=59779 RepID=UPI002491DDB6|nr:hypothetical protein [Paracoccus marcusii]
MMETQHSSQQRPDLIVPTKIEHLVYEIIREEKLTTFNNYLDYHFETATSVMRGRVYLDTPTEMILFGPYAQGEQSVEIDDLVFEIAVTDYAQRRFPSVKRMEAI